MAPSTASSTGSSAVSSALRSHPRERPRLTAPHRGMRASTPGRGVALACSRRVPYREHTRRARRQGATNYSAHRARTRASQATSQATTCPTASRFRFPAQHLSAVQHLHQSLT
jgi:hypothetical protein